MGFLNPTKLMSLHLKSRLEYNLVSNHELVGLDSLARQWSTWLARLTDNGCSLRLMEAARVVKVKLNRNIMQKITVFEPFDSR